MNTEDQFFKGARPLSGVEAKVLYKTIRRIAKKEKGIMTEETNMKNIPTEIYLQVDADGERPEDFQDLEFEAVSWCIEKIYPTDIKYTLADDVTPEPITPEALEREGWEKIADYGNIVSLVKRPMTIEINITSGEFWLLVEGRAKGVKTLQDLRTLERLVNG